MVGARPTPAIDGVVPPHQKPVSRCGAREVTGSGSGWSIGITSAVLATAFWVWSLYIWDPTHTLTSLLLLLPAILVGLVLLVMPIEALWLARHHHTPANPPPAGNTSTPTAARHVIGISFTDGQVTLGALGIIPILALLWFHHQYAQLSSASDLELDNLSNWSLIWAAVVVGVIAALTLVLLPMHARAAAAGLPPVTGTHRILHFPTWIADRLTTHRRAAVVVFLALFLCTLYYLAFALAFHDAKDAQGCDSKLPSPEKPNTSSENRAFGDLRSDVRTTWSGQDAWSLLVGKMAHAQPGPPGSNGTISQETQHLTKKLTFYYADNDAILNSDTGHDLPLNHSCDGLRHDYEQYIEAFGSNGSRDRALENIAYWNRVARCDLKEELQKRRDHNPGLIIRLAAIPSGQGDPANRAIGERRNAMLISRQLVGQLFPEAGDRGVNQRRPASVVVLVTDTKDGNDGQSHDIARVDVEISEPKDPAGLTDAILMELPSRIEAMSDQCQKALEGAQGTSGQPLKSPAGSSEVGTTALAEIIDRCKAGEPRDRRTETPSLARPPGEHEQPRCRRLAFIEYLYFMISKTAVTQDVGTPPLSEFTMFVASLATILEMFFVVVFFNVLLSSDPRAVQP